MFPIVDRQTDFQFFFGYFWALLDVDDMVRNLGIELKIGRSIFGIVDQSDIFFWNFETFGNRLQGSIVVNFPVNLLGESFATWCSEIDYGHGSFSQ